ncbi:envelope glycoprotein gp95-like [Patagioenas fasciata monilis]|uniref:Envelope glycoprotein gp95-like n=1 Tax=Patagioenas fasciata monilis TaxID=372326 RepID=A0A1V4KVM3_PATFA|nr:envelope glycoprotein gp95-like [Patagioenas fasciata monilis]
MSKSESVTEMYENSNLEDDAELSQVSARLLNNFHRFSFPYLDQIKKGHILGLVLFMLMIFWLPKSECFVRLGHLGLQQHHGQIFHLSSVFVAWSEKRNEQGAQQDNTVVTEGSRR